MEMSSIRVVHAAPDAVWNALNDPSVLKDCIPGCESLERLSDSEWRAIVAAKVGPVSARFNGTMRIIDPTPPTGYTLKFEGQGGAAGFANGEAKVSLATSNGGDTALYLRSEGLDVQPDNGSITVNHWNTRDRADGELAATGPSISVHGHWGCRFDNH